MAAFVGPIDHLASWNSRSTHAWKGPVRVDVCCFDPPLGYRRKPQSIFNITLNAQLTWMLKRVSRSMFIGHARKCVPAQLYPNWAFAWKQRETTGAPGSARNRFQACGVVVGGIGETAYILNLIWHTFSKCHWSPWWPLFLSYVRGQRPRCL